MENKIKNLLDQGLNLMSEKAMEPIIKEAMDIFKSPFAGQSIDVEIDNQFSDWFLNDYKKNGQSIFTMNGISNEAQVCLEASFLSIFKVSDEKNKIVFKDILSQNDYVVKTTAICQPGDLIKGRLYPFENEFLLIDEPTYFDSNYDSTIRKSIMFQYNSYCSMNGPTALEAFIKDQSLMIYHLSTLIEYYEGVLEDDESLYVYVAKYKIENKDLLLDELLNHNDFQLIEHNTYETLIHHLVSDKILAEVLVNDHWVEVECVTETDLMLTRDRLEMVLGSKAVFISESRLGLDDLLN